MDQYKKRREIREINQLEKEVEKNGIKLMGEIISDPATFQAFMNYLAEYYHGMPNLNPVIKAGILEEIAADKSSQIMSSKFNINAPARSRLKAIKEAFRESHLPLKPPPDESEFDKFWQLFE